MDNGALFFLLLIVGAFCINYYNKYKKEQKLREELVIENRKLIIESTLLEDEHLKFQLQPHTLRNMIATLNVAAKNLHKGSESLAETLDYILYQDNKQLVSIQDELGFIEKYKSLQGNFINQIDSIQIDKTNVRINSKYYTTACVPHLITAYFVENAFKHGDLSDPNFLKIELKLSETTFEMNVVNKIRQKPSESKGGLGLDNMRKRLELLLIGKFEISNSCDEHEYHSNLTIRFS